MWFLKFIFKKKFDAEFVSRFFQALSECIPDLELIWKKSGTIVAREGASSAVIKCGKKVLFFQGARSGWVDPFMAGEHRQALMDVTCQFQLGRERASYLLSIICVMLYLIMIYGAVDMAVNNARLDIFYIIRVCAALVTTGLMILSYLSDWSHNLRCICATLWIMALAAALVSSLLLLPLVWAVNRQQLTRLYGQNKSI
ncbi:MAG: hypothetical protein LBN41_02520 [Enterobacteriaceae bacterium]|jgi:hypothetical protein|nr:hypothetical protein [Enterobacteriaceae bacterium]